MFRDLSDANFEKFLELTRKAHAGFNRLKHEWETVESDADLTEEEKLVRVKAIMEEIDRYASMIGEANKLGSH